jgi:DNA repair protein RecO (recombination protein O)
MKPRAIWYNRQEAVLDPRKALSSGWDCVGRRDQGEADRVILLLAPTGRVDLLARGIRKLRSRKAGHLELFCRTTLLVSSVKDSWDIISQAEALAVHAGLRDDFLRGTYARYVAELVLRFFEGETEEELYTLVDVVFDLLEEGSDPERVVRWYEQRLLNLADSVRSGIACGRARGAAV